MLKAIGVGALVGPLTTFVWAVGSLAAQLSWKMWQQRSLDVAFGVAQVSDRQVLIVTLIGFALGFFWMMRRSARTTRSV
jgi:hypothetical protein